MISRDKFYVVKVPASLIINLHEHCGPVLLYLDRLIVSNGFALERGEFVTSISAYDEACRMAGISHDAIAIINRRD